MQQAAMETGRETDRMKALLALHEAALASMTHGLCMVDAEHRIVLFNQRFLDMYDLSGDFIRVGVWMRDVVHHVAGRGYFPSASPEQVWARRLERMAHGKPFRQRQNLSNGRSYTLHYHPIADGGWVTLCEDVTERQRMESDLREQNLLFDAALDNMAHGLCVFDPDWRVVVRNRRYLEIYGLGPDDAQPGTPLLDLMRGSLARGLRSSNLSAEEIFTDFKRRVAENDEVIVHRRLGGRLVAVRHQRMANGGWVGTYEDITERERAVAALQEQYRRFDVALNNMVHGLCMIDADFRVIVCNSRYMQLFGFSDAIVKPGAHMRDVLAHSVALGNYRDVTAEQVYAAYVERLRGSNAAHDRVMPDGRFIRITHQPMANGGWTAIFEDVTERHKAEQNIAHMARHDALTDLPNRVLLREKMAEGLDRVAATGESMAVLCLDLDNFKHVNDTLGHPIGDRMLRTMGERLRAAVRDSDTVARLGGDEFAILQCGTSRAAAEALARRLVDIVSAPMSIDAHEINAGVSIGIALAPADGAAADHLMKCADLALYRAKAEGRRTYRFFEPDMDARIQARRALELDLRRALTEGQLALVYQPQVHLASNEIVAMEALLRWKHAERGPVPPSEFIPLAEEMGLIVPLGEWVLRTACAEAARWPDPIKVAVNLSPVQFRTRGLVATVTSALAAAHLPAHRLEIEITEAVLLQEDEATVGILHQLRALGVRIAMDDFGTGYSSLSYLRSFPFDKIKIDRSFIADSEHNRDSAVIVGAIANLGASLGIATAAEGIETVEQMELVRRAGCTEMQGYLISPPLPVSEVAGLIARYRREVAAA